MEYNDFKMAKGRALLGESSVTLIKMAKKGGKKEY